jgi:hypothetical protein
MLKEIAVTAATTTKSKMALPVVEACQKYELRRSEINARIGRSVMASRPRNPKAYIDAKNT